MISFWIGFGIGIGAFVTYIICRWDQQERWRLKGYDEGYEDGAKARTVRVRSYAADEVSEWSEPATCPAWAPIQSIAQRPLTDAEKEAIVEAFTACEVGGHIQFEIPKHAPLSIIRTDRLEE